MSQPDVRLFLRSRGWPGTVTDTTTSVTSCSSDPNRHTRRRIHVVYLGKPYSPVTDVDFFVFQLYDRVVSRKIGMPGDDSDGRHVDTRTRIKYENPPPTCHMKYSDKTTIPLIKFHTLYYLCEICET